MSDDGMLCSKSIASMYGTKLLKLRMMTKVRKNKDPKDPPKQLSTEPHCNIIIYSYYILLSYNHLI